MENIFWGDINCSAWLKSILIYEKAEGFKLRIKLSKKLRLYLLLRDFEVSVTYLFISSHSMIWIYISSFRVGTGNLVRRRKPLKIFTQRSLTNSDYSTFIISDSIECENVEIIRITREKVELRIFFRGNLLFS